MQYQLKDTVVVVAGDSGFGFEKKGYYESTFNHNNKHMREALQLMTNREDICLILWSNCISFIGFQQTGFLELCLHGGVVARKLLDGERLGLVVGKTKVPVGA